MPRLKGQFDWQTPEGRKAYYQNYWQKRKERGWTPAPVVGGRRLVGKPDIWTIAATLEKALKGLAGEKHPAVLAYQAFWLGD